MYITFANEILIYLLPYFIEIEMSYFFVHAARFFSSKSFPQNLFNNWGARNACVWGIWRISVCMTICHCIKPLVTEQQYLNLLKLKRPSKTSPGGSSRRKLCCSRIVLSHMWPRPSTCWKHFDVKSLNNLHTTPCESVSPAI